MGAEMGLNRTNGDKRSGFIESVLGLVDTFYEQVVQHITRWQPSAPKSRKAVTAEPDEEAGEAMPPACGRLGGYTESPMFCKLLLYKTPLFLLGQT